MFPQSETIKNGKKCFLSCILLRAFTPNGRSTRLDNNMRIVATCLGLKIISPVGAYIPFFIKINELPQINDKISNRAQYFPAIFTEQK